MVDLGANPVEAQAGEAPGLEFSLDLYLKERTAGVANAAPGAR